MNFEGLDKLQNTSEEVKELQLQLEIMKPALEIAAKDADIMIKQIAADTVSASINLIDECIYFISLHLKNGTTDRMSCVFSLKAAFTVLI